MNIADPLDRIFYSCLKEMELSYSSFNKSLRIRIERWIEKLSMSGKSNPIWKKHRNAYAKLLLNMIISKQLGEPFHQPPPEGSLPPFPSHLISVSAHKNLLGPHESTFWRDLFKKIGSDGETLAEKGAEAYPVKSLFDRNTISSVFNTSYSQDLNLNNSSNSSIHDISIAAGQVQGRNIQNLKVLIKEQQQRIELLEEQLRHERIAHESEVHQLRYTHSQELERVKRLATPISSQLTGISSAPFESTINSSHINSKNNSDNIHVESYSGVKPSYFASFDRFEDYTSGTSTSRPSDLRQASYTHRTIDIQPNEYQSNRGLASSSSKPYHSSSSNVESNHQHDTRESVNDASTADRHEMDSNAFMEYLDKFQSDLRALNVKAASNSF